MSDDGRCQQCFAPIPGVGAAHAARQGVWDAANGAGPFCGSACLEAGRMRGPAIPTNERTDHDPASH